MLNAVFTGFAAWNTTRLPDLPAYRRAEGEPRLAVLRDWPYAVVVAITGLFSLHFFVMELGLALYISERTAAPPVMVAVLLILNTACVAVFQVRLSRRADSVEAGARALVRGSVWIAAGFAIVALADRGDATFAVVVLVAGSLVHVVGEMIGSGGQWGLQMGLAPHERQGQYQGFAGLGFSVIAVVGPPVVTLLCVDMGETGLAGAGRPHAGDRPGLRARLAMGAGLPGAVRRDHPLRLRVALRRGWPPGSRRRRPPARRGTTRRPRCRWRAALHAAAHASRRSSSPKPAPRNHAGARSPWASSASPAGLHAVPVLLAREHRRAGHPGEAQLGVHLDHLGAGSRPDPRVDLEDLGAQGVGLRAGAALPVRGGEVGRPGELVGCPPRTPPGSASGTPRSPCRRAGGAPRRRPGGHRSPAGRSGCRWPPRPARRARGPGPPAR